MTFPKLFDSKAAKQDEQMFNKPKNVQPRRAIPAGSSTQFWTPQLINRFLWRRYGGQG